jgi:hypothetical protein
MKLNDSPARSGKGFSRAFRNAAMLAVLASVALAPSAASGATYPVAGGNGFDTDSEGWSSLSAICEPSAGPLCTMANSFSGAEGAPPGSIESRMEVILNGGELFQGKGTWRSPSFEAQVNGAGSLHYDRRFQVAGLVNLAPVTKIESVLVNDSKSKTLSLGSEDLTAADSEFATKTAALADEALSVGDSYHLELRVTTTTSNAQAGLTGPVATRFDNVFLRVANEGPGGSSGSPGVTFPKEPATLKQISKTINKFNWSAEKGNLPGGSVIARRHCTIVGTPGRDRITGSTGNDVICGLGGNDKIRGRGGRDLIDGGSGNDRLYGSGGKDTLAGLAGKDRVAGGAGSDQVGAGAKQDNASGNGAGDLLKAGSGADRLSGGGGNDRLSGGKGRDRISGGGGKDRVLGAVGNDRLRTVERR